MRDFHARVNDAVRAAYARQSAQSVSQFMGAILQTTIGEEDAQGYEGHYEELCRIMAETNMMPSKHQFAVAASAMIENGTHKKQMWRQPAGTGKLRTLLSMIYLFTQIRNEKHFTVYFANQEQIEADWPSFHELQLQLNLIYPGTKIVARSAKRLLRSPTRTVNFVDEADYFLIDAKEFKVSEDDELIGLTATTFK